MARKLQTYQTSLGFFDLAIAAPSMKAALEAWGAHSNLFHQGVAKESDDPDVIAAAMKKPGVVLRRPVGPDGSFSEHAELPTDLGGGGRRTKVERKSKGPMAKRPSLRPIGKAAERKAALAFETEQKRRQLEQAKEETARQKDRERRQQAIDKAQAALDKAEQEHAKRVAAVQAEVEALEKRSQAEKARWDKEKERLEVTLRRARS
ncbi:cell envelope biogenesis protein TolA [Bradyrhizobium sp. CCBAU 53351]|uniref:cell envelope biogenesis protein TolA n=1 Tax=Bradyrhizobium sp. CCBAU 53351 TaxID=1325114 RepID=UPI001889BCBB|nr:cell envelope biogenesis protein TolA [Bradyrhizobium sp. CCBAU 53351]